MAIKHFQLVRTCSTSVLDARHGIAENGKKRKRAIYTLYGVSANGKTHWWGS